ncbi:unnamed protein product [Colletotrichum noveboracense]|uniref:Protein kinase domain-containing protein n=1 Tax=Colletotrichum noveboracense TaxID=2664923 RepID=A0A9W4S716_9PEZI|nr:unnamed protein product [Colletotrichum noveboracense]
MVECQRTLRHPSILRLYGHFDTPHDIYLVLEYTCGGDLFDHMQSKGPLDEGECARYIAQMAFALVYLHRKRVMHRDFKPENILIGLHDDVLDPSGLRNTLCGTPAYLAPEIPMMHRVGGYYDERVDAWSLGVLMYELLGGVVEEPRLDINRTEGVGLTRPCGVRKNTLQSLSPDARGLMEQAIASGRTEPEDSAAGSTVTPLDS